MARVRDDLLDIGAFLTLVSSGLGFLILETLTTSRLILTVLIVVAVILARTSRDRILWSLTTLFAAGTVLLSLLGNGVLPSWLVFPILSLLAVLLFVWMSKDEGNRTVVDALLGLGVGVLVVQALWFLLYWPFDPRSKAAVLSLFFYALWTFSRGMLGEAKHHWKEWVTAGIWLFLVLLFVIFSAEWYA